MSGVSNDSRIQHDFSRLINQKKFSDVVFRLGPDQTPFYAHKIILAAASDDFASMLYSKEHKGKGIMEVSMPDVSEAVFTKIMTAIYTNTATLEEAHLGTYIAFAHKYHVKRVLDLCVEIVGHEVTIDNACLLFEHTPVLCPGSTAAVEYILNNVGEVILDTSFGQLSRPRLEALLPELKKKLSPARLTAALFRWAKEQLRRDSETADVTAFRAKLKDVWKVADLPEPSDEQFNDAAGRVGSDRKDEKTADIQLPGVVQRN